MSNKKRLGMNGREIMVLGIVAVLAVVFSLLSPQFRTYNSLVALLSYSYFIVFAAIGVCFPLITGGVDLSVGTGLVAFALIGGNLYLKTGAPVILIILLCLLLGVIMGAINGFLVAVMDLPPFLATLCTCMINRGIGGILSGGFGVTWPTGNNNPDAWYQKIFVYKHVGETADTNVPVGFFVVILVVIIMSFVLNHTKVGRYTIAIGSNKEATKLAGVNVKFYHIMAYVICGLFTGLSSIAYVAYFKTVYPGGGAGLELDAIGAAIVGGVSASGGSGTVFGTFLGVYVIMLLKIGLPFIGLQANWQQIILGFVLIGTVLIDVVKKKK